MKSKEVFEILKKTGAEVEYKATVPYLYQFLFNNIYLLINFIIIILQISLF